MSNPEHPDIDDTDDEEVPAGYDNGEDQGDDDGPDTAGVDETVDE